MCLCECCVNVCVCVERTGRRKKIRIYVDTKLITDHSPFSLLDWWEKFSWLFEFPMSFFLCPLFFIPFRRTLCFRSYYVSFLRPPPFPINSHYSFLPVYCVNGGFSVLRTASPRSTVFRFVGSKQAKVISVTMHTRESKNLTATWLCCFLLYN